MMAMTKDRPSGSIGESLDLPEVMVCGNVGKKRRRCERATGAPDLDRAGEGGRERRRDTFYVWSI